MEEINPFDNLIISGTTPASTGVPFVAAKDSIDLSDPADNLAHLTLPDSLVIDNSLAVPVVVAISPAPTPAPIASATTAAPATSSPVPAHTTPAVVVTAPAPIAAPVVASPAPAPIAAPAVATAPVAPTAPTFNIPTTPEITSFVNSLGMSDAGKILLSGQELRKKLEEISIEQAKISGDIMTKLITPEPLGQNIIPTYSYIDYDEEWQMIKSIMDRSHDRISEIEKINTLDPEAVSLLKIMRDSHETIIASCKLFTEKADARMAEIEEVREREEEREHLLRDAAELSRKDLNGDPTMGKDSGLTYEEKIARIDSEYINPIEEKIQELKDAGVTVPDILSNKLKVIEDIKEKALAVRSIFTAARYFEAGNGLTDKVTSIENSLSRAKNEADVDTVQKSAESLRKDYDSQVQAAGRKTITIEYDEKNPRAGAITKKRRTEVIDLARNPIVLDIVFGHLLRKMREVLNPAIYNARRSAIEAAQKSAEGEVKIIASLETHKEEAKRALAAADTAISNLTANLAPTSSTNNPLISVISKGDWARFSRVYNETIAGLRDNLRGRLDDIRNKGRAAEATVPPNQKIIDACTAADRDIRLQIGSWESKYNMSVAAGEKTPIGNNAAAIWGKYAFVDGVNLNTSMFGGTKPANVTTPNLLLDQRPVTPIMPVATPSSPAGPIAKRGVAIVGAVVAALAMWSIANTEKRSSAEAASANQPVATAPAAPTPVAVALAPVSATPTPVARPATPAQTPTSKFEALDTDKKIIDAAIRAGRTETLKGDEDAFTVVAPDIVFRPGMTQKDIDSLPDSRVAAINELRRAWWSADIDDGKMAMISGKNILYGILGISLSKLEKMPVPALASQAAILRWYRDGDGPYAVFRAHDKTETTILFREDIKANWVKIIAEYDALQKKNRELQDNNRGGIGDDNFYGKYNAEYEKAKKTFKSKQKGVQDEMTKLIASIKSRPTPNK